MADGSADTIYRVLTVYSADTSAAKSEVGSFAVVLDHVMHLSAMAKDALVGMVGTIMHVGSEAEKARISIAGLFGATGLTFGNDFNTALAMSTEMLAKMRKDAAALPGTFEDLTEIFQRVLPGGANAGKSANDIEGLSAKMMAVGKGFGMPAEFIGREMAEMLEGRASSRVTLFAKLRQFMGEGMDAQKFNAMAAPEKWEAISKALEKFNPMIKEYATTWDAISSTSESYLTNIIRVGSSGIFEYLKQALSDINDWYERNEQTILSVATVLFNDLGGAIRFVVEMVRGSLETVVEWIEKFGLAKDSGEAVQFLVRALEIFSVIMGTIIGLTLAWKTVQWGLNFALLANPIGMVVLAIAALAGVIAVALAELDNFYDTWTIMANDPAMRAITAKLGISTMAQLGPADPAAAQAARVRMASREIDHLTRFGSTGLTGDLKAMMETAAGRANLWAGDPAIAHGNMNNPQTAMGMALFNPGAAFGMASGTGNDINALLNKAGKPVTNHTTNIGAINMYNNIYDAQDPARVLQRLTVKAVRENVERAMQSPSVSVFR
jgi:hypothetical protein